MIVCPSSAHSMSASSRLLNTVLALLDLAGTYGDPEVGESIQYDELVIEPDQGAVEIVASNRAILLFSTDSEAVTTGAVATLARPGNVVVATAIT